MIEKFAAFDIKHGMMFLEIKFPGRKDLHCIAADLYPGIAEDELAEMLWMKAFQDFVRGLDENTLAWMRKGA